MHLPDDSDLPKYSQAEETNDHDIIEANEAAESAKDDSEPTLDEADLEEHNLSVDQADQIVWDPPKSGSAGSEEKDFTD